MDEYENLDYETDGCGYGSNSSRSDYSEEEYHARRRRRESPSPRRSSRGHRQDSRSPRRQQPPTRRDRSPPHYNRSPPRQERSRRRSKSGSRNDRHDSRQRDDRSHRVSSLPVRTLRPHEAESVPAAAHSTSDHPVGSEGTSPAAAAGNPPEGASAVPGAKARLRRRRSDSLPKGHFDTLVRKCLRLSGPPVHRSKPVDTA